MKMAAYPKLLIIDDEPDFRRFLAENLKSEGIEVDEASSPEKAKELLAQTKYSVITTDIRHSNSPVPGDAFIFENLEQLKQSQVIVYTANRPASIERFPELQELGIPILQKGDPADRVRLIDLIKKKLESSTAGEEALTIPVGFELIDTIDENVGWIGQLSWSPDGKRLAAHTSQRGVLIWSRENKNTVVIDSSTNPTGGVTWSPDGITLAYSSKANVLLFDTIQMEGKGSLDDQDSDDRLSPGLAWSPDGKTLAIGYRSGAIRLYDPASRSRITSFEGSRDWTFALVWSPDSSLLVAGGDDNIVRTWNVLSTQDSRYEGHTDQITCLASCPTEDLLASGSADKSIRIWNRSTGEHIKTLEGHTGRITSTAFSPDGSLLASKSYDGTVRLWRSDTWDHVATLEEQAEIPGGLYTPGIAFHPKELILATLGHENAKIRIWKLNATALLPPDEESILSASVSDQPTSTDSLGFEPYVKALARFLTDERTQPPLTLSIEGEWGAGKSSFMLQLERELKHTYLRPRIKRLLWFRWMIRMRKERIPTPIRYWRWWGPLWPLLAVPKEERYTTLDEHYPTFLSVRFNAWRHDKDSSLWASFALALLHKLAGQLPLPQRAWTRLKLTVRRFKWTDGWPVLLRSLLLGISLLALSVTLLYFLYIGGLEKILGEATEVKGAEVFVKLISGSGVVGVFVACLFLLNKLKETVGDPFKSDLKKYLQTPHYDAQISFIEQFHADFGKIIQTFAGKNKVYVFIDDLDRSEVPKAADLMQAINLLISDSPQVFFIVGMDRDKVAAGLAVKYEKILPYLCAPARDQDQQPGVHESVTKPSFDATKGLEFGYSFIEKFIQIPFRIPQPGELGLATLLDLISPMMGETKEPVTSTQSPESNSLQIPASTVFPQAEPRSSSPRTTPLAQPSPSPTREQEERRERIRITVTRDSTIVRKIVEMAAPALDYNPRRIKQFINMFRLKALIAAETGLFDVPKNGPSHHGLTLPQLGKFVAISLKWPRLLIALDDDYSLLRELEKWATGRSEIISPSVIDWTHYSDLAGLLIYGCKGDKDPFNQERPADYSRYSLANIDVQSLLRITPPVSRPPQVGS
jgi:WD40 repeat protein